MATTAPDLHHAIHAVYRIESAKLISGLMRMVRDVGPVSKGGSASRVSGGCANALSASGATPRPVPRGTA